MASLFLAVKTLHVLSAIVAIGANATYGLLIRRAERDPAHLGHVLQSVRFVDRRLATPSYVLVFLTGLGNIYLGGFDYHSFWLGGAVLLFLVVAGLALFGYTPALDRQTAAYETHGADSSAYQDASRRSTRLGVVILLLVTLIVWLMVTKPLVIL